MARQLSLLVSRLFLSPVLFETGSTSLVVCLGLLVKAWATFSRFDASFWALVVCDCFLLLLFVSEYVRTFIGVGLLLWCCVAIALFAGL